MTTAIDQDADESRSLSIVQEKRSKEVERKIIKAEIKCGSCGGHGFHAYSDPCDNCDGTGRVIIDAYADCGDSVEECECVQEVEIQHVGAKVA